MLLSAVNYTTTMSDIPLAPQSNFFFIFKQSGVVVHVAVLAFLKLSDFKIMFGAILGCGLPLDLFLIPNPHPKQATSVCDF